MTVNLIRMLVSVLWCFKTGFLTKNKKPRVYSTLLEHIREYQMCVCQQLEKASSNFFGELCIFFLNKLLQLDPSKCLTKATFRFTPKN